MNSAEANPFPLICIWKKPPREKGPRKIPRTPIPIPIHFKKFQTWMRYQFQKCWNFPISEPEAAIKCLFSSGDKVYSRVRPMLYHKYKYLICICHYINYQNFSLKFRWIYRSLRRCLWTGLLLPPPPSLFSCVPMIRCFADKISNLGVFLFQWYSIK